MKYLPVSLFTFCISCFIIDYSFAQPGSLDNTFDNDGMLVKDLSSGTEECRFVITQPDGKILLGGYFFSVTNDDVFLLRLNSDGSTDSSFDNDGFVSIDFYGDKDFALGAALQTDGKIVITGYSYIANWSEITLARLNSDGSADSNFSSDGKTSVHAGTGYDEGWAVAIQPDGKILVAGTKDKGNPTDIVLIRFNNDGSVDSTFHSDGIVSPSISGSQSGKALALQPDGKILVSGGSKNPDGSSDICIVRYTSDGYLDTTFGDDGIILQDLGFGGNDGGWSVALQQDAKVVVASPSDNLTDNFFAIVRYHTDGSPDSTFGNDGIATFDINGTYSNCYSVKISADGKMIVAGRSGIADADFILLRCNPDGTADSAFGINGIVTIDISDEDYGFSTEIQPDGKILIAGYSTTGPDYNITVARVLSEVATETGPAISDKHDFSIFPNPSSESFTAAFFIRENSNVRISLLDAAGRIIKTIAEGNFEAGDHQMNLSAEDLPGGIYLLQLKTGASTETKKLIVQ